MLFKAEDASGHPACFSSTAEIVAKDPVAKMLIMAVGSAKPLAQTVAWAIGAYLAILALHWYTGATFDLSFQAAGMVLGGALYTNLFEHAWHRYGMHSRRHDPRHARHHQLFYGQRFQSRDPEVLREITTAPYIFPLLLASHYTIFIALFPAPVAPAFFLGVTGHFVIYEITHWYTHVADNQFDRLLARVPFVNRLRANQIRHHRLHHAEPQINFNFNPPFAGDRIARVLRR
jgi:hypothetical protein